MSQVKETSAAHLPLAERTVVVTGASSGIGRAIALACAKAGADLVTTYRSNHAGAEAVAAEVRALGRRMVVLQADIAVPAEIERLATDLKQQMGRVDVWINNAGADILTGHGAELSRLEKLDLLLAVDLRGTMLCSWAAVNIMKAQARGGVIINMSWDGVMRGLEGENPQLFSAAKGAVLGFSKSLARTVAPKIRVNVLGPGWIETAFGAGADSAFKSRINEMVPLRRWGTADDVAGAAVFLASDASSYVTGQMIMINGGDVM